MSGTVALLAEFQGWADVVLVSAGEDSWEVLSSGERVGTWQRTDDGAVLDDCSGERVAIVTAFAGTSVAAVAGCGAHAGAWSDLAHKVLAGQCEMRPGADEHAYREAPDAKCPHLANAQCSCGWRAAGFTRREVAPTFHAQHVTAVQREAQAAS